MDDILVLADASCCVFNIDLTVVILEMCIIIFYPRACAVHKRGIICCENVFFVRPSVPMLYSV